MQLISFSGLDGSGKTEQIKRFKNYLASRGKSVFCVHIIKNSLANRFLQKLKHHKAKNQSSSRTRTGIMGILLRKLILATDILLFRVFLIKHRDKDFIIADRYFYDYLINIYFLEGNSNPHLPPFLMHLIPRPQMAFYLAVQPETAHKRKPDQGIAYLEKKKLLFEKLKKAFSLVEIPEDTPDVVATAVIGNYDEAQKAAAKGYTPAKIRKSQKR